MSKNNKKTIMELIVFSGIVLWCVFNYTLFIDFVKFIFTLVMPLIVGAGIAFIINVPMKQIERKIFKIDKRKNKKVIRIISFLISIILIFGIIGLVFFLVIPEFISAINMIAKRMPDNFDFINKMITKFNKFYPNVKEFVNLEGIIKTNINAPSIVGILIAFLRGMVSRVVIFFVGFIISIYILLDKENLVRQTKKILDAFFSDEISNKIKRIAKLSNNTFTSFLTGQCMDACLTGFIFFIILSLARVPYALILGVLFAITALIPYIGAFATLLIGAVLVAVVNPIYALWYVIIFFIVQQFDDNFTYPKIVGKSVGLPALWAFVAVLIGGSMLGVIGMIISIPVSSILYTLLKEVVEYKISKKKK